MNRSIESTPSFVVIPLITNEVTNLNRNPDLLHGMDRNNAMHRVECILIIKGQTIVKFPQILGATKSTDPEHWDPQFPRIDEEQEIG